VIPDGAKMAAVSAATASRSPTLRRDPAYVIAIAAIPATGDADARPALGRRLSGGWSTER
jgi:hypothetical protein